MGEFVFIDNEAKQIQKLLNQWKHQYKIELVTSRIYPGHPDTVSRIAMMIYRTPINVEV